LQQRSLSSSTIVRLLNQIIDMSALLLHTALLVAYERKPPAATLVMGDRAEALERRRRRAAEANLAGGAIVWEGKSNGRSSIEGMGESEGERMRECREARKD
jgi:hypothetical protein